MTVNQSRSRSGVGLAPEGHIRAPGTMLATMLATVLATMLVGLIALAPVAQARPAATLTLNVSFGFSDDITVTLPDGTPVGTKSGAPTVIPAGFYTVSLTQPGCVNVPYFDLRGPGVSVFDNLSGGEVLNSTDDANFLPNSTYTWRNDDNRSVVYTFVTSSDVVGTPPPSASSVIGLAGSSSSSGSHSQVSNSDVVGSGLTAATRVLSGSVASGGNLSVAFNGKSVKKLAAGRYTIRVTDRSTTSGFMLEKGKSRLMAVSGTAYTGKRSASVNLTPGKWSFLSRPGKTAYTVVVS